MSDETPTTDELLKLAVGQVKGYNKVFHGKPVTVRPYQRSNRPGLQPTAAQGLGTGAPRVSVGKAPVGRKPLPTAAAKAVKSAQSQATADAKAAAKAASKLKSAQQSANAAAQRQQLSLQTAQLRAATNKQILANRLAVSNAKTAAALAKVKAGSTKKPSTVKTPKTAAVKATTPKNSTASKSAQPKNSTSKATTTKNSTASKSAQPKKTSTPKPLTPQQQQYQQAQQKYQQAQMQHWQQLQTQWQQQATKAAQGGTGATGVGSKAGGAGGKFPAGLGGGLLGGGLMRGLGGRGMGGNGINRHPLLRHAGAAMLAGRQNGGSNSRRSSSGQRSSAQTAQTRQTSHKLVSPRELMAAERAIRDAAAYRKTHSRGRHRVPLDYHERLAFSASTPPEFNPDLYDLQNGLTLFGYPVPATGLMDFETTDMLEAYLNACLEADSNA